MSQIGSCHVDTILEYLRRVRVDLLALALSLSRSPLSTLPYMTLCLFLCSRSIGIWFVEET
jgi:hypothetical protein